MDTTLIINPGSSSKKYALYRHEVELLSVSFEHTKNGYGKCVEINGTRQQCENTTGIQYEHAIEEVLDLGIQEKIIQHATDIRRVGIRIVAPGTFFRTHRVIDQKYMNQLRSNAEAAPLHIPHEIEELAAVARILPHARVVGVSDSAFHTTLPAHAHWYSLPKDTAKELDVYRSGYHGLSVSSVVRQVSSKTGRVPERMIVCHVGSGVSVTALKAGKSVDTTMGFAPTSGLMMGTRAGDIDPSGLMYLLKKNNSDVRAVEEIITEKSGLKGILGTGDLRIALDRMMRGDRDADVAVTMYMQGIRKAIGAYTTVLEGLDALILTGTAAERNPLVRKRILEKLEYLGITLNDNENERLGERAGMFQEEGGAVSVQVLHTAEMAEINHVAKVF